MKIEIVGMVSAALGRPKGLNRQVRLLGSLVLASIVLIGSVPAVACVTCLPVTETFREPVCCCAPSAGTTALTGENPHRCGCDIAAAGTRAEGVDRATRPLPAAPSSAEADAQISSPARCTADAVLSSLARLAMTPSPPGPSRHDSLSVLRI